MQIVTTSQLLYRIKGNAKSLATIAVLSAVTLTAVGTSVTMYYNTYMQAKKYKPVSYSYEMKDNHVDRKVNEILKEEKKLNSLIKEFSSKYSAEQMAILLTSRNVRSVGANEYKLSEEKLKNLMEELKAANERKVNLLTKLYGSVSKVNMVDLKLRLSKYYAADPFNCVIACWGTYFGCYAACETYACQYACEVRRIDCIYLCNNPS